MALKLLSIAPDYILCSKSVETKFVEKAKKVIAEWYGSDPQTSPDLTRIINKPNFLRLQKLLKETNGKVAVGGDTNEADLYIAPTIVGMRIT